MTEKKDQVAQEIHPLLDGEMSYIRDWGQWKELWLGTRQAQLRHGLLHFGFEVEADWPKGIVDRVCMYLDIADSHGRSLYKAGEERLQYFGTICGNRPKDPGELRGILSQKAFNVLCEKLFKNTQDQDSPSWAPIVTHPVLLEKIFRFLRLDREGKIRNLPRFPEEHHLVIAREFAFSLCLFLWREGDSTKSSEEDAEGFRKRRSDIISLLFGLYQLDILEDIDKYELDEDCRKRLEELALGFDLYLPSEDSWQDKHRKPADLNEACLGGNQAAKLLMVRGAQELARQILDQKRELHERVQEAQKGLKKLSGDK